MVSYTTRKGDRVSFLVNVRIEPSDKSVKSRFMTVLLINGIELYNIFSENEVILEEAQEENHVGA